MTFKNFHCLAKKPEMRSRVGYSYFNNYDMLLSFLNEDVNFFKYQIGKSRSSVAKEVVMNDLKITLERIQFVNMCRNNEL